MKEFIQAFSKRTAIQVGFWGARIGSIKLELGLKNSLTKSFKKCPESNKG